MKLSEQKCKTAKAREKNYKLSDGGGLYLEVTTKGSKLWRMKYRFLNMEKKLSIGEYPVITLYDARQRREEAKKLLANGLDPSSVKQEIKKDRILENANTFEVIAREWHQHKSPEWSKVNAKIVLERLERDVFPEIGKYPIRMITHKMLLDLANTIKQRGANELAKRLIQMCRHIYRYAIVTGRADQNIAEDLKGMIKAKPQGHYAAIEAKDLPEFITDLRNHKAKLNRQTYLAVNFMMLTFVRTSEMIKARWEEFDLKAKTWLIPASRMKMGKEHLVPLSRQAVAILEELREIHNHPVYVFPSRNSRNKTMSNNTILMALDRMGYRGKMTGHGFRALAMSTIMEKLGYRHEVPDLQLAHAKRGDVARAYDRAKFLSERTKMMQEWADYLDKIVSGGTVVTGKFGNRKG
ncbi:MAG: tyrosine-type recombinase/integrase [Alphaproteobacteria bacterium]|nr:tyrosine-type recombinase/integrase [Alphaproteobacteria bacterium]MBP7763393.1 tyrosine-type recombinase/integrase [Alphaproteobacteria bacterium]MBP7905980.1 tyrosine-type recombinase/integrase [Alphaproteobacteria bacterium]